MIFTDLFECASILAFECVTSVYVNAFHWFIWLYFPGSFECVSLGHVETFHYFMWMPFRWVSWMCFTLSCWNGSHFAGSFECVSLVHLGTLQWFIWMRSSLVHLGTLQWFIWMRSNLSFEYVSLVHLNVPIVHRFSIWMCSFILLRFAGPMNAVQSFTERSQCVPIVHLIDSNGALGCILQKSHWSAFKWNKLANETNSHGMHLNGPNASWSIPDKPVNALKWTTDTHSNKQLKRIQQTPWTRSEEPREPERMERIQKTKKHHSRTRSAFK